MTKIVRLAPLLGFAALIVACSTPATYQQRLDYLRTVANRGAETHALLLSQEAQVSAERCTAAFRALDDGGAPVETSTGGRTPEWRGQIQAFFVDSCVSGKPRPVTPSDGPTTPPTTPPSG